VYDIGEHEGQSFLAMEYIDGEDLASLLKRVGRVPEEKGVEVARQLGAALGAVHDQGLLHRDLKPANVMLDGRGQVRLTDFGLAAAAQDLSAADVRSGTPLYQAPEQRAGREVTARSDLYSLGLVLYELFTGRRPFPGGDTATPPSKPSSHVSGLSPAVEQVILRCLEPDPADRPRSATAVLAALPGGDPLAAALAAGQTPSPRLVADADPGDGRLRPAVALGLVAAVVAGVFVCGWIGGLVLLSPRAGMREAEPALMRHQAREVLAALGHDEPPADSAYRYLGYHEFLDYRRANDPAPGVWDGRWRGLEDGRPPAMYFFYRSARGPLAPTNYHIRRETSGQMDSLNPPPVEPGMAGVALDLRGRLLRFHKVADYVRPDSAPPPADAATDWRPAFAAAGLDYEAFAANPVPPRLRPPLAADARFAWDGPYPDPAVDRVRVEAAAVGGKPVFFVVVFPWDGEETGSTFTYPRLPLLGVLFLYGLPLVAAGLAWRNWRAGRADLAGAAKLAGVLFALWFARWALTAHHVADNREHQLFEMGLGLALYQAVLAAALYLALEPVVRKRWPWRLVGWTRLLAGRVRDPLVARDVLVGLATGTLVAVLIHHRTVGPAWAPELTWPIAAGEYEFDPTRCVANPLTTGVGVGFLYFFLVFLAHWACRDRRLGAAVVVLALLALFMSSPDQDKPVTLALSVIVGSLGLQWVALRFGLLAFLAAFLPIGWLLVNGWSLDVRAWYATGPTLGVAVMLALTLYAAYTATGGRLLGKGEGRDD
jgi:serine/threonine-protein kinase